MSCQIRIEDPDLYQSMVDAEWDIIYEKLALCVESGAQIILSRLPIGDLATQYFADRDLFCAGRVAPDDVHRIARATGACSGRRCIIPHPCLRLASLRAPSDCVPAVAGRGAAPTF